MTSDEPTNAPTQLTRPCAENDVPAVNKIINAAALAYRGVIPADCWHEPYMPMKELLTEMAAGIVFTGYFSEGDLIGVMGIQQVRNVCLIRHAYVLPESQGLGIGSKLLSHLREGEKCPILIGTWRAASWAIRFYERHGFELVPEESVARLLHTYWRVPERQIETSVVLASPRLSIFEAARLIEDAGH
jgi:GNAT superfamily N-acetyltransferase